MNPRDTDLKRKNILDDIDRMTNEGLAGGWSGEMIRNGEIDTASEIQEESPPTVNGKEI